MLPGSLRECHPCKPRQAWLLPEPALLWEDEPLEPRRSLSEPAGLEKATGSFWYRDQSPLTAPHTGEIKPFERSRV